MQVYLSEEFIYEVNKILKSNSHADCEQAVIESIYLSTLNQIKQTGSPKRLGGDPVKSPFIRKRISVKNNGKSSGYRLYFWLKITEQNVYLLFIHPKTGKRSKSNISPEKQKQLVKTFVELNKTNGFIPSKLNKSNNKIIHGKTENIIFGKTDITVKKPKN